MPGRAAPSPHFHNHICAAPGWLIASVHGISGLLIGTRDGVHICQTEW